ncbi:MAG: LytTR family DNA-binding domain-containing protein, partial [Bacteroidota bacterium]
GCLQRRKPGRSSRILRRNGTHSDIIIDDVASARTNLKADLESYCPEIKVIGEAEGVISGAKAIRQHKPQVVFLDIQMQDGSGFDLLEVIGNVEFQLIFTTASDAHAIQAFRFSAIDYLLKPVDPDELVEAVKKLQSNDQQQDRIEALLENVNPKKKHTRLALHTAEKVHIVAVDEIVRIESSANYSIFYLTNKQQLLVTRTLKEYDQMLKDQDFIRVHQSHLVNAAQIKEYVKIDGGYLKMLDGTTVVVSHRKKAQLIQRLGQL